MNQTKFFTYTNKTLINVHAKDLFRSIYSFKNYLPKITVIYLKI